MEELVKTKKFSLTLRQLTKYGLLSLLTYLVYSGICTLLLMAGASQILAITLGFTGATSFNFFLSRKIFLPNDSDNQSTIRSLSRFIPAVLFNLCLVLVFNSLISKNFVSGLGSVLAAPFIPALINFFVMKYLVFNDE